MAKWQIRQCIDPEEVYRFLMLDRIWAGYALCDLESPLWEHSSFYWGEQGNKESLALHVDLGAFRILSGFGDPEGVNATWSEIRLPLEMQYSVRTEGEVEGLRQYYHLESLYPMWRLHLKTSEIVSWDSGINAVPIGSDRSEELSAIFQGHLEKKNYFEGWFLKHCSEDLDGVVSIIPGSALNSSDSHAFIQVMDGNTWYARVVKEIPHRRRRKCIYPSRRSREGVFPRLFGGSY